MKQATQTRKNLTYCTADGVCATPWVLLSLPGSFIAAGLLNSLFKIGPFWFGIVAAMPALANAVHIFLVPLAARFMKVRDLTISGSWLNLGAWFSGLITLGFMPTDAPNQAGLFFAIHYGVISLSGSLVAVGWTAWMTEIVPSRIRGRYLGRRNRMTSISTLGYMLLSLLLLNYFGANKATYGVLISVALVARIISTLSLHLIHTKDPSGGTITKANWAKDVIDLRKHRPLLRFIMFGAVAGVSLGIGGALGAVYALEELGVSPAAFTSYSIVATISGTLCVRIWGELIDRHGAIPILIITFLLWRLCDIGWVFISPDSIHWMYLMWINGGAMGTGYLLATFTLLLKLIPRSSRSAGISLNLTIISIAGTIAPLLAGYFIANATSFGVGTVLAYRMGMGTSVAIGVLSISILLGMKEPETDPKMNTIHGAMRTLRNLTVNQGLSFLSNTSLIARRKNNTPPKIRG